MELHDHSHLRDACRDEDVFLILSWSLNEAHLEPSNQVRIFRHLYVIMLLILEDVFLTFGFDLDYRDHTFGDGWFHVTPFSTYHISDAILGHIPFQMRFMDLHGVSRSSPLTKYTPIRGLVHYFIMILQWSPSWVIQSGPHFSTFGCRHTSPFEVRIFYLWV